MANWLITLNERIIKQFSLEIGDKVTIGRGKEADIIIDNTAISRLHIALESTAENYIVSDMGSTNGTFVDGEKIQNSQTVSNSSLIEFGKFRLSQDIHGKTSINASTSISADILDPDEETIFVAGTQKETRADKHVSRPDEQTKLTLVNGSALPEELIIERKNSIKIGKDASCDIVVPGFFVAKAQCYIFKRDNDFFIVPQKSWVGTFVNDIKINQERKLIQGDIIKIRNTAIRYNRSLSREKVLQNLKSPPHKNKRSLQE